VLKETGSDAASHGGTRIISDELTIMNKLSDPGAVYRPNDCPGGVEQSAPNAE